MYINPLKKNRGEKELVFLSVFLLFCVALFTIFYFLLTFIRENSRKGSILYGRQ